MISGNHRLICGDARDAEVFARLMDGRKAQMVFTETTQLVSPVMGSAVRFACQTRIVVSLASAGTAAVAARAMMMLFRRLLI
jgi:hypothetical protein